MTRADLPSRHDDVPDFAALLGDERSEREQRAALRGAKRTATGFLVVAALVYLATFLADDGEDGVVGFVRAAAEAGVVGGLADWFAVTALFRHPLGLPIPHTALVPTRKDQLAASLGAFVTGHFLTRENVSVRLAEAGVVVRVGRWVTSGDVAERIGREVVMGSAAALEALRPEDVADLALEVTRRDAARRSYAALAGELLADVTAGGGHRPLLDVALPYLRHSIQDNRATVHATIKGVAERHSFLLWLFTTDKRVNRLIDSYVQLLQDMEDDPSHELRGVIDRFLLSVADDLRGRSVLAARLDALVDDVLRDPRIREWLVRVVDGAMLSLRDTLGDQAGPGPQRVARALRELGARIGHDAAFRARLESVLERVVLHIVENYAGEFSRLIEDTVARWDGPATADRIELAAGRDLQFIRINGTVVGSLAGLAIHTVAVLLA